MVLLRDAAFSGCFSAAQPRFATVQIRLPFFFFLLCHLNPSFNFEHIQTGKASPRSQERGMRQIPLGSGRGRANWVQQEART